MVQTSLKLSWPVCASERILFSHHNQLLGSELSKQLQEIFDNPSWDCSGMVVSSWTVLVEAMKVDIHKFLAVIDTINMPPTQCLMLKKTNLPVDKEEASTSTQMTLPPPPLPVKDLAIDMNKASDSSSDDGMDAWDSPHQKPMSPNELEKPLTSVEEEQIIE